MISKEMQAKKDWCSQCNGTGFIAEFHGSEIVEHPCPNCIDMTGDDIPIPSWESGDRT